MADPAVLSLRQGILFEATFLYREVDEVTPRPLTGFFVRFSTDTVELTSLEEPSPAKALVLDEATGTISLRLGATTTAAMQTTGFELEAQAVDDPDHVFLIASGKMKVTPQVRP